ncbi:M48 family metallopeptidase [Desulfocurvus sp. DL9XJH121]
MQYTPRLPRTNVNVSPGSRLGDLALMLGALAALAVLVYAGLGLAVDYAASRISFATEQKIMHMLGGHPILRSARPAPDNVAGLAEAVRARTTDVPGPVRVLVRDDDHPGAFALPGGVLLLTSGLLRTVQSQNELAFVLGHELGHVAHRDHLRALGRGLVLMSMSALVLDADSGPGRAVGGMIQLTDLNFTRTQEFWADEAGQDALFALYGHVQGAVSVLDRLGRQREPSWLERLGSTHPDMDDRLRHLRERAKAKGYPERGPLLPVNPGLQTKAAPLAQPQATMIGTRIPCPEPRSHA